MGIVGMEVVGCAGLLSPRTQYHQTKLKRIVILNSTVHLGLGWSSNLSHATEVLCHPISLLRDHPSSYYGQRIRLTTYV
jgi:hypothetical protein